MITPWRPVRQHAVLPISGLWHTRRHLSGHKLAICEVRAMREWAAQHPMSVRQQAIYLAPIFHVGRGTVLAVLNRETWAWLPQC